MNAIHKKTNNLFLPLHSFGGAVFFIKNADLYDLRVELYDLRVKYQKKVVILQCKIE